MMQYLVAYVATLVVFLGIDFVWLKYVARTFYFERLGPLLLEQPNFVAAGVFYLGYVVGIVYFAVLPAMRDGGASTAVINGALLGLLAYATYDMSNYATLKNWSLQVTLVDMVWGAALTSVSGYLGYLITNAVLTV